MSSKILFLGDMHIGARKSSPEFHAYFADSLKAMFEYIKREGIKTIVQVGDMFDVRQHTTTYASLFIKEHFIYPCQELDLTVYCLVGNHDAYFKEKVSLNSVRENISPFNDPRFVIIDKPQDLVIEGSKFSCFPWICKETIKDTSDLLKDTDAKYAVGHFEFVGFEYHKGTQSTVGYSHSDYSKFDLVISGHYHTTSRKDNVLYTGVPYQLTWVDYKDPKGFWVFDDGKMSFVENHLEMFKVFDYPNLPTVEEVKDKVCRIRVNQTDATTKEFVKYKDSIDMMKPIGDVKVIELKSIIVDSDEKSSEEPVEVLVKHPIDYVKSYCSINTHSKSDLIMAEVKSIFENLEKHHDIS